MARNISLSHLTGNGNEMLAIVAELDPGHELRVAEHRRHAFAGQVVIDGQGLVGARRCNVHAAPVQGNLDEGSILTGSALECSGMLSVGQGVDPDVSVLASGQDVFVVCLKGGRDSQL